MVPKQAKETTQITKVELPKWVDQASQSNYQLAQKIARKPYTPYTGQTVAATDPITLQANKYFQDTMGTGDDYVKRAAAGIPGMDRSQYSNPFTSEVIDRSLADMDRSRMLAQKDLASGQIKDKTFGGSRSAISSGLLDAETTRNAGDMAAKLRAQGFDTSSGLMQGDLDRLLPAADSAQKLRMGNYAGLTGIGQANQQQTQKLLDDKKGRFDEKQGYDTEKLNLLLSSLGMSPYGKTENVNKKETSSSGTDWASMGAGILSILPALFGLSEESEKTDITLVGKDPLTKLKMYAYRYKGDPKTYPKVVGPMAGDVEKIFPQAVRRIGGKRVVQSDVLEALRG